MAHRTAETDGARKTYNHPCVIAQTLDVLGDRWTLLILRDLMAGLHRYNDILESCAGMSPNVLSDRLKRLESEGLVDRNYYKELPPRVEYTLTEKGWTVRPILSALVEWGREHTTGFTQEQIGHEVSTDFAMRVVPAFSFHPERAGDLVASMSIEIADSEQCNSWTLAIHDGHIHPQRQRAMTTDIHLKTSTSGFFQFIRGQSPAEALGELTGSPEIAAAIQACFLSD
ncbi:MAG: helix-turn-helix domain-containing protein [Anaerolineaceae bacterium]